MYTQIYKSKPRSALGKEDIAQTMQRHYHQIDRAESFEMRHR